MSCRNRKEQNTSMFIEYLVGRKCLTDTGSDAALNKVLAQYYPSRWFRKRVEKFNRSGQLTTQEAQILSIRCG